MSDRHAVLLVHGIRTRGVWQKIFMEKLQEDFHVAAFDYGWRGVVSVARRALQERLADQLYDKICQLRNRSPAISVIAHSLGTHLLFLALKKYVDVRVDTVILAASILSRDAAWNDRFDASQVRLVVNYRSHSDLVVRYGGKIAGWLNAGMGRAGYEGLAAKDDRIVNRELTLGGHTSVTDDRFLPDVLNWLPGGSSRDLYFAAVQKKDRLMRTLLLPEQVMNKGTIGHVVPELVIGKTAISLVTGDSIDIRNGISRPASTESPRVLVMGEVGEGKTTTLLLQYLQDLERFRTQLGAPLPMWVSVAQAAGAGANAGWDSIVDDLTTNASRATSGVNLYVDGLDENVRLDLSGGQLGLFTADRGCRMVVASGRTQQLTSTYTDARLLEWFDEIYEIQPWPADAAIEFARTLIAVFSTSQGESGLRLAQFERIYREDLSTGAAFMTSPLVISMVVSVLLERAPSAAPMEAVTSSTLYRQIVDAWAVREAHRNGRPELAPGILVQWDVLAWAFFRLRRSADLTQSEVGFEGGKIALDATSAQDRAVLTLLQYETEESGAIRVYGFRHESLLEYFVAKRTVDRVSSWRVGDSVASFVGAIDYTVHETIALFLKDLLARSSDDSQRRIAENVEHIFLGETLSDAPSKSDLLRVNGLLYLVGRLPSAAGGGIIRGVWQKYRQRIGHSFPQAYITLLSSLSLNNDFQAEAEYVAEFLKNPEGEASRTLVGWHLIYYGDKKSTELESYVHRVLDPVADSWKRSRNGLLKRLSRNDGREIRLGVFYLTAFWALAYQHRYQWSLEEQGVLGAARKRISSMYPERNGSLIALDEALQLLRKDTTFSATV